MSNATIAIQNTIVQVNEYDLLTISNYSWFLKHGKPATTLAFPNYYVYSRRVHRVQIPMDRLLYKLTPNSNAKIIHQDGNGLDCRRSTMRLVPRNPKQTTFIGTIFYDNRWHFEYGGQYHGPYPTEWDAAVARDRFLFPIVGWSKSYKYNFYPNLL